MWASTTLVLSSATNFTRHIEIVAWSGASQSPGLCEEGVPGLNVWEDGQVQTLVHCNLTQKEREMGGCCRGLVLFQCGSERCLANCRHCETTRTWKLTNLSTTDTDIRVDVVIIEVGNNL